MMGDNSTQTMLVIFDKDGTLITFQDMIDWVTSMVEKYAERLQKPIHDDLYKFMGFDPQTNRFSDGLICDTDENIMKGLSSFLQQHGMEAQEATQFAETHFYCYKSASHKTVPIDNPKAIFTELKKHGIKVAVCTSDSVPGKDAMIQALGLGDLVDFSLCGNEPEMRPKPHPGNIEHICKSVGVQPSETVMVGDAIRDMEMGKAAKCRLSVGVLTGVCDAERLKAEADVIIPSIKDILPVVIPGYKQ